MTTTSTIRTIRQVKADWELERDFYCQATTAGMTWSDNPALYTGVLPPHNVQGERGKTATVKYNIVHYCSTC